MAKKSAIRKAAFKAQQQSLYKKKYRKVKIEALKKARKYKY